MPSTTLGPASPCHPSLTAPTEWIAGYVGPSLTLSLWMHDWSLIVFLQRERKPALWRGRAAVCVGEAAAVPLTGHHAWRMHGAVWRRKCVRSVRVLVSANGFGAVSPDAAGTKSHHLHYLCFYLFIILKWKNPECFFLKSLNDITVFHFGDFPLKFQQVFHSFPQKLGSGTLNRKYTACWLPHMHTLFSVYCKCFFIFILLLHKMLFFTYLMVMVSNSLAFPVFLHRCDLKC